jgi:hypothetical protein
MVAAIAPNTVDGGGQATVTVSAGEAPFKFAVSVANSNGPKIDNNGVYTAGSKESQVVDTITITGRNGDGGRARVTVTVLPMTVAVNPAVVPPGGTAQVTVTRGVAPFSFAITNRESPGSTINNSGLYKAGNTLGTDIDTITVTDSRGTRLVTTVTVQV